ncbi:MAG TPA: DUF222 domain-containing protein [Acidimicrobiia bacterium]|nr:DUF222 domain-containing protein [Acidimicrobiia bacterium]
MFDPLDDLERAVDKVIASERELDLPRLRRLADRLEGAWLRAVRGADAGELAGACRMSFGTAKRAVETSAALAALPVVADALVSGAVSPASVRVITDACTPARADRFGEVEAQLVDVAQHGSVRDLRGVVQRAVERIDADGGAAAEQARYAARDVRLSVHGQVFARLDAEGTEIVYTALETRMAKDRDRKHDRPRIRGQRRHDALVDICRHYLASQDEPRARRGRPHVSVVVDLEVLRGQGHGDVACSVRADLEHVGAVSRETLRRMTCDAHIHRVIIDGSSLVLDVGRATRTVSDPLWRALVARDGHCQAPGCDRPPGWCEAHHIWHWEDGGPTDLDNLMLLCWRHHREHHEHDPPHHRRRHAH